MVMSDLSEQPEKSIWLASGSRANAKAVYRMIANEKLTKESILSAHRDAVSERSAEEQVLLAVQDTMSVNYNGHTETKGLGYNCEQSLGKSFRWLETMEVAAQNAPAGVKLVHIADREGDIYELYAQALRMKESFVIRAAHKRLTTDKTPVLQSLRDSRPLGKTTVIIPDSHKNQTKEREAVLTVQVLNADILKPQIRRKADELESSLPLTMIRLWEEFPSDGAEPVEWLLMTNIEVNGIKDAVRIAGYYKQRWKIERFHFVLKSGCKIEKIQQRSVDGIELVILMYSIIAIHIMILTFLSRVAPKLSCDIILSEAEWKTLHCAANRTRQEPEHPPPMKEAVRLIACLGGHVGAKSDGEPGLKVIWIGLNTLFTLVAYRDFL